VTGTSSPRGPSPPARSPRGGEQADRGDVVGAAVGEELDRCRERAAGGEHRVEHVALASGQVVGEPLGVRRGLERLLVAHHPEEADLGRRQQPHHPVEHAEPGAQDGDDQRLRVGEPHPGGRPDGRDDVDRTDPDVARRLVRQQRDQLVDEATERRGVGRLVAQVGELVRDERVVDDVDAHGTHPSGARSAPRGLVHRRWSATLDWCPTPEDTPADRPVDLTVDLPGDGIDFALAAYREEGIWRLEELVHDVLGDVEALAHALRRFPGDGGAVGLVAVDEDFFLIVRVAGATTRILLSDVTAGDEWELAASAIDALGLPTPEDEDEQVPAGDLDLLGDLGMGAMDMGVLLDDFDLYPDEMLSDVARRTRVRRAVRRGRRSRVRVSAHP
jgi:putative tRNA adenosine deaminase-associated protein